MKYVGLQQQIRANNFKSFLLIISFPALLLVSVWAVIYFTVVPENLPPSISVLSYTYKQFLETLPYVLIGTATWFVIAYSSHSYIIRNATGAKPLERRENKRVYNLVENLCISQGMQPPHIYIIPSEDLNAFASGINSKSYAVTLTQGIIHTLNDEELEGVIAHELAHIRNRDVRTLIISIIFVGIFSFLANMSLRTLYYRRGGSKKDGKLLLIIFLVSIIAYFFSIFFKMALSRKREYVADAAGAAMCGKPWALASALRKIAVNYRVDTVKNEDVTPLFIHYQAAGKFSLSHIFATHPPIEKRIALLEQF